MVITPADIQKANEQSRAIAESSKLKVEPPSSTPSLLDAKWEAVRRSRQK